MKLKKVLFLAMAICLASGVKAQFYDGANDIYYYVGYENGSYTNSVLIFNFDGRKACLLASTGASNVQENLKQNSDFYAERVETTPYDLKYESSSSGTHYVGTKMFCTTGMGGETWWHDITDIYDFSYDRKTLTQTCTRKSNSYDIGYIQNVNPSESTGVTLYKKVDKSYFLNGFFGVGRQRK